MASTRNKYRCYAAHATVCVCLCVCALLFSIFRMMRCNKSEFMQYFCAFVQISLGIQQQQQSATPLSPHCHPFRTFVMLMSRPKKGA